MNDYDGYPVDVGQIKIDTRKLWDYGVIDLPTFSDAYGSAATDVWHATAYQHYAYQRGEAGEVPPAFETLSTYLELLQSDILYQTASNLIDIAKMFERVAFEIADQDGASAENLDKHAKSELDELYKSDDRGTPPSPRDHAKEEEDEPQDSKDHSEGSTPEYKDGHGVQQ